MEFGVFILAQQRGYHQSSREVIRNAVEQTVAAEAAGFDTAWYAEHHFNNYSLCPSPLMMIAHCAALTERIRLGSAVCVLPFYHPARLLGEIGFADTVSNGRLDLGIGSGYQQFEFERFGVELADAHALFAEFYELLQAGLSQRVFSYEGKHLAMPPTSIAVRTVQTPMPPIWVTSGSADTLALGMRHRHNLFVTALLNGLDAVKALRQRLETIAASAGQSLDEVKFGFLRCAYKNRTGAIYKIQAGDRIWHQNRNEPAVQSYTPGPALIPGVWFEYEIVVQGDNYSVFLTNTLSGERRQTTTFNNTDRDRGRAPGFIGVQVYPGSAVAWRHIRIKT